MNRIRSKDLSSALTHVDTTLGYFYHNGSPATGDQAVSFDWRAQFGYEYMFDSTGQQLADRDVVHCKTIREYLPIPLVYSGGGGTPPSGSWTEYPDVRFGRSNTMGKYGLSGIYDIQTGAIDGLEPQWSSLNHDQVVQKLYTAAREPVMEGLVNLVELDQLPGSLKSLADVLPHKAQNYAGFQRVLKRARRLSKKVSSAFLAYQFGIAPMLSDIQKTAKFLDVAKTSMEKFSAGQTRRQSSILVNDLAGSTGSPTPVSNATWTLQKRVTYRPTQRWTLVYRYKRFLQDTFAEKPAFLLGKLGFADPAEILWELIPYSFIVDWFVDTSGLLAKMDDALGLDPIETISCCYSRKWQAEVDAFRTVFGYGTASVVYTAKAAQTSYSYYKRMPLGRTTYVGPSKRFGNKQVLLSIALARQRLR